MWQVHHFCAALPFPHRCYKFYLLAAGLGFRLLLGLAWVPCPSFCNGALVSFVPNDNSNRIRISLLLLLLFLFENLKKKQLLYSTKTHKWLFIKWTMNDVNKFFFPFFFIFYFLCFFGLSMKIFEHKSVKHSSTTSAGYIHPCTHNYSS